MSRNWCVLTGTLRAPQPQSPFIIFQRQKNHNDDPIQKVQDFIEGNYQKKLTVDLLSHKVNIGRRSFERRFKKATGNTFSE